MSSEPWGHGLGPTRDPSRKQTSSRASERKARPLSSLFPDAGWQLGSQLIEPELIERTQTLLVSRHALLQRRFSQWSGDPIENEVDFARASGRIAAYEALGLPKDLRHFLTGEFDLETRLDPIVRELLRSPALKQYLCRLLDDDQYYVHYPPMIRFKIAGAQASLVPLHQDSAYNTHMREFVTVWIPFADVSEERGGVLMYDGSHTKGCITHQQTGGTWASKANADLSDHEPTHVEMNAGDALLFPSDLLHESAPYQSATPRYSIDFRIFRWTTDTTKSYYDPIRNQIERMD